MNHDSIRIERIEPWLAIAVDRLGIEHAVLSDGWHHIRLDIEAGTLGRGQMVVLRFQLFGIASAEPHILPLRRLLDFCRHRRFARGLFPPEPKARRWLAMLRVHDAVEAGASQREIGAVLFGRELLATGWTEPSDSLRSRVRRLVGDARAMARGGYRSLLRDRERRPPIS
jgi:hypothetical protein